MDERLFRLAHEAMVFNCVHVAGQGWRLNVRRRRGDECWEEAYSAQYSHLSTSELLDVLLEEASAQ